MAADRALQELDHEVAPADDVAAIWSVTAAREATWVRAQVLRRLRDEPELVSGYLAVKRADHRTGRAGDAAAAAVAPATNGRRRRLP